MGLIISFAVSPFDDTDAVAAVGGSSTVTLRTYNGKGSAFIAMTGDGDSDVEIRYAADGGADVIIATSDVKTIVAVSFQTQLLVKAKNNNAAPKNHSSVSTTGGKQ